MKHVPNGKCWIAGVNKDVFKFSFGHRVKEERNKLPEDVINAEGINSFKTQVDKFLRNKWGSL